jgi:hypothetical protein
VSVEVKICFRQCNSRTTLACRFIYRAKGLALRPRQSLVTNCCSRPNSESHNVSDYSNRTLNNVLLVLPFTKMFLFKTIVKACTCTMHNVVIIKKKWIESDLTLGHRIGCIMTKSDRTLVHF